MRYASAFTAVSDGYRAGTALGEQLAASAPEVVIIFCSEHYLDSVAELVDGLHDVLGPSVRCCGGSGDGVYWREGMNHHGVAALAWSSDGTVTWALTMSEGVHQDSFGVAQRAAEAVTAQLGGAPDFAFVMADGCRADGARLVEGLRQSLPCPFFGGLAADDRRFERTGVFVGARQAPDSLFLLAGRGPLPFHLGTASGWCPVGEQRAVTEADGTTVRRIDGQPAHAFLREQLGQEVRPLDLGVVPLAEYPRNAPGHFVLRTPAAVDEASGEIRLFGRIPQGALVRTCRATMGDIVGGVDTALSMALPDDFQPAALLVISCAGRKWLLTETGREEVERVRARVGDVPFIGLPSFGEIGPFRDAGGQYSPVQFHNVTFVVCALGR